MKTTVELSENIANEFKAKLHSRGMTMKAGLHEAIRMWLSDSTRDTNTPISLDDVTVGGTGLQTDFQGKGWETIRDAIYRSENSES